MLVDRLLQVIRLEMCVVLFRDSDVSVAQELRNSEDRDAGDDQMTSECVSQFVKGCRRLNFSFRAGLRHPPGLV